MPCRGFLRHGVVPHANLFVPVFLNASLGLLPALGSVQLRQHYVWADSLITYERLRLSSYGWWTVSDGAYVEEAELLRWFHRDSLHLLKALRYDGIRWASYKDQPWEETLHRQIESGLDGAYTLDVVVSDHILAVRALQVQSSSGASSLPLTRKRVKPQNCI